MTDKTPTGRPHRKVDPWKKIAHRLDAAYARLIEAHTLIEKEPDTGHISDNLWPVVKTVGNFRDLAAGRITETKEV